MMEPVRHVVILAGGAGSRLWPWSREHLPKHLLKLDGKRSLLQVTFDRVRRLGPQVYVVTQRSQAERIREQLADLPEEHLLVEPGPKGTAAALGMAALEIARSDPGATMISVHADHDLGPDDAAYLRTLTAEAEWAEARRALVTSGLKPSHPSSGLGYLRIGEAAPGPIHPRAFEVAAFVEKPDRRTAETYLRQGGYLWHLGLFSWPVDVLLDEMARHAPDVFGGLARFRDAVEAGDRAAADAAYLALEPATIDDAILQRTHNLLVVCAEFRWHDVGSWDDLHTVLEQDGDGNAVDGDHLLLDSHNCLVRSSRKFVAAIGLDDMIIVETDDALLVCPRSRAQDVKRLVERLKQAGRTELV